jgi:hypothetical protein
VLSHPYFGSEAVVKDLRGMRGFEDGHVDLGRTGGVLRNPESGLIDRLVQGQQHGIVQEAF